MSVTATAKLSPSAPAGTGPHIRALRPEESVLWDELVQCSPQGTLFHRPEWFAKAGLKGRFYGYFRGGKLCAGCAVGLLDDTITGHPVLTPYLGILLPAEDGKYVSQLSDQKEIATLLINQVQQDFSEIFFRFSPEVADLQPFIWAGFEAGVRYTYRLKLGDVPKLLEQMDAKRRNDLRRAEREGVQVEEGGSITDILNQVEKTFQRKGVKLTFRNAAERIADPATGLAKNRAFLARSATGEPLGGVWIVWDEKRAYYLAGGYDESAQSSAAVALALWRAILYASNELKLAEFDFEGSMMPPVERFFRKFGGTLLPTYTVAWHRPVGRISQFAQRLRRIIRRFGLRL